MKLTKKDRDLIVQAATNEVTNYYTGSGRWSQKSADYQGRAIELLKQLGLANRHYISGNRAPKGGWQGYYVRLTAAGRKLKIIRDLLADDKSAKEKARAEWLAKHENQCRADLRRACEERLAEHPKSRRPRINSTIRFSAEQLGLNVGEDIVGFCQKQLA